MAAERDSCLLFYAITSRRTRRGQERSRFRTRALEFRPACSFCRDTQAALSIPKKLFGDLFSRRCIHSPFWTTESSVYAVDAHVGSLNWNAEKRREKERSRYDPVGSLRSFGGPGKIPFQLADKSHVVLFFSQLIRLLH